MQICAYQSEDECFGVGKFLLRCYTVKSLLVDDDRRIYIKM